MWWKGAKLLPDDAPRYHRRGEQSMRFISVALALMTLAGLAALLTADEPASKDQPKQGQTASDEEIKRLVRELGDDDFTKRMEAKKKLEAIGEPAIGILKKAAES